MGKLAVVFVAAAAACLLAAGRAASDPVWGGQCGIAAQQTVWGEYGWPTLLPILAHRGTLLAVTQQKGSNYAAEARARGAATYNFDLVLKEKAGTPTAPADPTTIQAAAQKRYGIAVSATGGCTTPLIVENELFGASTPTPWTTATAQYRANVLAFLQDLSALGGHPVLLINKPPFTGSPEAVAWWLAVAKTADIVREDYLPATAIWKLGPILGNRALRESFRDAVTPLTSIGVPANRLGLMLSFLSQKGVGGRNGLQPASAWFQVVKWEALSAKEVTAELHLGSVFSWGWQEWNAKEMDPAKPKAACVWLWARTQRLCNAPRFLGPKFDRSLSEGQIKLAHGTVCRVEGLGGIGAGKVAALQALTGDRDAALSAMFERLVEVAQRPVSRRALLGAEREVIADSFHGSRDAYLSALRQAHASVAVARSVLADEVRRARLEQQSYAPTPSANEVAQRPVSRRALLGAEREVIADSFHGSRAAYLSALRQAHASVAVARSVLADELRRARLEQQRYAPTPSANEVAAFYSAYPDLPVRRVRVSPAPPWLAARPVGYALAEAAPQRLFALPTGRKARVATLLGTFAVRPLGASQPLGSLPISAVRSAIVATLRSFERAQSFERWTIARQNVVLNQTICLHDKLPQPAAVDLTQYLPFLRIQ